MSNPRYVLLQNDAKLEGNPLQEVIDCLMKEELAFSNILTSIRQLKEAKRHIEEKDIRELRKRLQDIFEIQYSTDAVQLNRKIYEAAYHALIKLAQYWPLNDMKNGTFQCPITSKPLSAETTSCTLSGYQFSKDALQRHLANSNKHPVLQTTFHSHEINAIKTGKLYPAEYRFDNNLYNKIKLRYMLAGGFVGLLMPAIVFGLVALLTMSFPPTLLLAAGFAAFFGIPAGAGLGQTHAREASRVEVLPEENANNVSQHPLLAPLTQLPQLARMQSDVQPVPAAAAASDYGQQQQPIGFFDSRKSPQQVVQSPSDVMSLGLR